MRIEIVQVLPRQTRREVVELARNANVGDALAISPLARELSDAAGGALDVGIFGERCALGDPLNDGDRIEIYRPLALDPMRQRRERAKK